MACVPDAQVHLQVGHAKGEHEAAGSTAEKYSSRGDPKHALSISIDRLTLAKIFNGLLAASSQRGGQGFESPLLHPGRCYASTVEGVTRR